MRIAIRCVRVLWISTLFCAFIAPSFVSAQTSDIKSSLGYLIQHQDAVTGGLVEENDTNSSLLQTSWGIIALASAGYSEAGLSNFLAQNACQLTSVTDIERTVLAITASGNDPRNFNDCDIASKLEAAINHSSGLIGTDTVSTIFGILAIRSYDGLIPDQTIDYLVASQQPDGGWDSGWGTESNITAQAVMALASAGYDKQSAVVINAKQYLKNLQTDTGGIKYDANAWTAAPDAFSDAYTLQAIYALGESPTDSFWQTEGKTILDDLAALRQSNDSYNFSISWGTMNPVWTTAIVIPALEGKSLGWRGEDLIPYSANMPPIPTAPNTPAITPVTETIMPTSNQELGPQTDTIIILRTNYGTDTTTPSFVTETPSLVSNDVQILSNDSGAIKGAMNESLDTSKPPARTPLLIMLTIGGLLIGAAISIVSHRYGKIFVLILFFIAVLILPSTARAARAGVVVRHSNGDTKQRCVDFTESTISGLELLKRANINPKIDHAFVVELDGEQAKSFNEPGASDDYWSYWNLANDQWQYARLGATYNQVHDGEINGWQRGGSTLLLAPVSFEQICPTIAAPSVASTSEPVVESASSNTPSPLPTKDAPAKTSRNKAVVSPPSTEVASISQSADTGSPRVAGASTAVQRTNYTVVTLVTITSIVAGFLVTQGLAKQKHKKTI